MYKTIKQKLSNLKNSHSKKHLLAAFCLVLFFVFFYSHNANAITWTEWVKSPFSSTALGLVVFLLKLMLKFTSFLLSSAETLFVYIVDPDNMKSIMDNNAIYTTWRTVRDVFNIAFIMVLLFSAFSTIFQVSKYGIKTIWLNLVLMALLVNFSYPIARFIIDASNMLMYGFLNNLGGTNSFLVLIEQSGLSKIIGTESPDPLYLLSAVVFTFIFAITLLTIALLLVIRTITLAIYIIFSPIAFTGSILPGTALASSASSWWTDFMKQCFAGPIIIFFLYVANKMMLAVSSSQDGLKNIAVKQVPGGVPVGSIEGLADLIAAASFFALPIIILWYGIIMAQDSAIKGASAVVGYGKKAMKWSAKNLTGYRLAKFGTQRLGHAIDRDVLAKRGLSLKTFKEAWKSRQADLDRKAYGKPTGAWRDRINKWMSLGKEKANYYEDAASQSNIATKEKEIEAVSTNSEYLVNEFKKAEKVRDTEKMTAIIRIMFKNNDQNEFMKLSGKTVEPFAMKNEIHDRLKAAGLSEQEVAKQMSDLSEIAIGKGNYANYGMAQFDPTKGEYRINADTEQARAAIGKISNIKAQTKADLWHWNSFLRQNADADGTTGELHDIGKAQLSSLTSSSLAQMDRVRGDFVDRLSERIPEIRAYAATEKPAQAAIINRFADHIEGLKSVPGYNVKEKIKQDAKTSEDKKEEKTKNKVGFV